MKRRTRYETAPKEVADAIAEAQVVADFLPAPEELILRPDTVKVTLALSRGSVDFFKKRAAKSRVPYQAMIRKVVDLYAERYKRSMG